MISERFRPSVLSPLSQDDNLVSFDCGEESLNTWLRNSAMTTARRRLSATHVWTSSEGCVVAYITLVAGSIRQQDLPKKIGRGLPDTIPVVLLARLALDKDLSGQGLGSILLLEALRMAASSATSVGAALVVVDALHEKAAEFYLHHDFVRLPGTTRLVMKITAIPMA